MADALHRLVGVVTCLLVCACGEATEPAGEPVADTAGEAPSFAATLVQTRGDVRAQSATSAAWTAASPGLGLSADDAVQTMERSHASISFDVTGAIARLGPSTTLRIPTQAPDVSRLRHVSGTLTARVEDEGRELEVELPPGTLRLDPPEAGSATPVEAQLEVGVDTTEIVMVSGSAEISPHSGSPIRVHSRHYLIMNNEGGVRESGLSGTRVVLMKPEDGATIRTRSGVRFEWSPTEAEAYVLEVTDRGGDTRVIDADGASTVVNLATGEYEWLVRGVEEGDALPPAEPRRFSVVRDRTPPPLTVDSPRASAIVRGPSVQIVGRTEPGATVRVDGTSIAVGADGAFRHPHSLPRGLANVVIVAMDDLGNARTVARAVRRE